MSHDGKPSYFTTKATVMFIKKDNVLYKACPGTDCNKKVIDDNGEYRCEKCQKTTPNFKWRMMISFTVADATAQTWISGFQDVGEKLLGMSAEQLGNISQDVRAFLYHH